MYLDVFYEQVVQKPAIICMITQDPDCFSFTVCFESFLCMPSVLPGKGGLQVNKGEETEMIYESHCCSVPSHCQHALELSYQARSWGLYLIDRDTLS